jgi:hypothetical protein
LNNIYTPQAVVNGRKEFLGSNKSKLISSIEEQLNERSTVSIKLNVVQTQKERSMYIILQKVPMQKKNKRYLY